MTHNSSLEYILPHKYWARQKSKCTRNEGFEEGRERFFVSPNLKIPAMEENGSPSPAALKTNLSREIRAGKSSRLKVSVCKRNYRAAEESSVQTLLVEGSKRDAFP